MAHLIYSAIMSLDGYVSDSHGNFDWGRPDDELYTYLNNVERRIGTYLFGRRMYEVMVYWETAHTHHGQSPVALEFARIWQSADKIVYSRSLESVASKRTRIEREFDVEVVRQLKQSVTADICIAGPTLAAQAMSAGLVDELHAVVYPVVLGSGLRAWLSDRPANLEFVGERRFQSGVVHLHYQIPSPAKLSGMATSNNQT